MKKLKLYIETSVWGFLFADDAPEKKLATERFFKEVETGKYEIFISETVRAEFRAAPDTKRKMLYEMVGDPEADKEMLDRYSPSLHADQIKTPLFIAQGAKDPRVKQSESDQMVEALKQRGVDVQYLLKENEGHGFRNEENRFEFYEAMEKFLSKHLGK